jgi:hypothetical protein
MTPDEFAARLPKLTSNPLPIEPPFVFNGMSARVFPLRAHLGTLQRVCDGYLNFIPPQAGYFRAPMPYVFVMVLDYGQVTESVARIGWFAQTEVFFLIPLEWYKFVNGRWVFHDWAVITPYVFVNDSFSVPLGRTVFGFPKVLAQVTKTHSDWVKDATAPVTLARVETAVFPETYTGSEIQNRVFLEIERGTISNLQVPFDASSPVMPWSIASHAAQAMAGFSRDAAWLAQSMRISPVNPAADPGVVQSMLQRMAPWFAPGGNGFVQNSINLKQFRKSQQPSQACYQSVTNGCMEIKSFNGAGLLGEYPILLGDLSGGHTVRLYEYPSLPIVQTLGLEVDRQWHGAQGTVAELKPVVPFWLDVDIKYGQGDNIAWRSDDRIWRDNRGVAFDPQPPDSAADSCAYNLTVTTAIDDIAGPFEYAGSTVRVLPLLAKLEKLESFLHGYINQALEAPIVRQQDKKKERLRFSVWSRPRDQREPAPAVNDLAYVYLMVSSFGSIASTSNNVGDWTKYQLSFMIPVRFEHETAPGVWELIGVGLVPAFSFVDNCIAAIARLEVQGFEAAVANFYKPESVWLSDEVQLSDNPKQTLLRVDTEVWPAIGEGQKAIIEPVIEICQGEPEAGLGNVPDAAWKWSSILCSELRAKKRIKAYPEDAHNFKTARALALELLGNQMPFTAYSLKQFRDAREPQKACYQSLVRVPRCIKELDDLREIEETLVVRIHDYPSLDIAGTLGLVVTAPPTGSAGIVSCAQAVRPFFLRGTLFEPLAQRLGFRSGTPEWNLDAETVFSTPLSDQPGAPPITVDYQAETLQDQMDPCRIGAVMYQAAQRRKAESLAGAHHISGQITPADARRALDAVDPQTVIECILSREWGNADANTRWRAGRQQLIKAFSALPLSGDTSAFAESTLYRQINDALALVPGAVASTVNQQGAYHKGLAELTTQIDHLKAIKPDSANARWQQTLETIILSLEKFTRLRLEMESAVSLLASVAILKPQGVRNIYASLGKHPPSNTELIKLAQSLLASLNQICSLDIAGQPSDRNDLDTRISSDRRWLHELLVQFPGFDIIESPGGNAATGVNEALRWAIDHTEQFRQLVDLARGYCDAQSNAFLNKLSRAYQKPDFCVQRDSVGSSRDETLPLSLSWDQNWYYGREVSLEVPATLTPATLPPAAVKRKPAAKGRRKRAKV